jgi:uncharacterized protein (TIGR02284 family)
MEKNRELFELLNDLVVINNDRIEGYERAINESSDTDIDLKSTFESMANQSRKNVNVLTQELSRMGGEVESGTTVSGKIYRVWMDLKAAVTDHSRKSILGSCEFGEDVALKTYKTALESDVAMPFTVREILEKQKEDLQTSHDLIKNYRDTREKVM